MPDPVATPPADAPARLTEDQIMEEAISKGMEAAEAIEPTAVVVEPVEVPEVEVPEVTSDPDADTPPAETPPEADPPAEEPAPEPEPEPEAEPPVDLEAMTDEQRDEHDAKELGFKNQKANREFKAMRKELRELRPLQETLADVQPLAERWNKVYSYCQMHNIDQDAFGAGMAMIAGTRSPDVAVMTKTLEGLEWEADRLRQKLGIGGGTYDPLKEPDNADLARAVENEEVTEQIAHQMARQRAELKHRTTLDQQQRTQSTERETLNQARAQAISDLDAIEAEYKGIDPQYAAKAELLVPMLQPIFAKLPPSEWPGAFRQAYMEFRLPASAAPTPPPPQVPPLRNQPLRPSSPAGGQTKQIQTEEQAMEAALAAAAQLDGVPFRASA